MKLREFYSRNRVPIYLIFLSFFVFGIISLIYLDFNLIPDIEYPELICITYYPSATPEEVKNIVSSPIEQIALSLKGVRNINTLSREGMSVVRIGYHWGENLSVAHIELREKMDLLKSFFPKEVKRPIIISYEPSHDAIAGISVVSNETDARSLYLLCKKDIAPFVEKTEGLANVAIHGGEKPEVKISIDPENLVKYNIGVAEIKSILSVSNKNFPVGFFNDEKYEYLVRVNGEVNDYRELGDIVLKEEEKRLVYLKDIAEITYTTEEKESDVLIDGESALMLSLYKQPSYNIIKASRNIDQKLARLNERYRGKILFHKVFDESVYIKESLRDLIIAMAVGILFTVFSVFFFLYDLKVSLLIIVTIPLSIISTFIIMKLVGISVNLLTLGGFSLAIGMMVDNAVIVTSAVFRMLSREKKDERFYETLRSIIPAVFSATLTTIVVFFPVLFLSGILRLIFLQLSVIIVVSLLFSLAVAVVLIPVMLERIRIKKREGSLLARMGNQMETAYTAVLSVVLKKRPLFILLLIIVIVLGLFSYQWIDKRFIESIPGDYFYVKVFIKQQVPYEYTSRFVHYVSEIIRKDERVSKIIATVGVDKNDVTMNLEGIYGVNTAVLKIYTRERGDIVYSLIQTLRKSLSIFSGVDFVITIPDNPVQRLISRSSSDVVVKIFDPSSDFLAKRIREAAAFLKDQEFVDDVLSSYYMANSEQSLLLKRDEMSIFKVDAPFLGEFISSAISGLRVGTWKKDEYDIPILLRLRKDSVASIENLLSLSIKNSEGREIRLNELLTLKQASAPSLILRENQKSYAKVEFNQKRDGARKPFFRAFWSGRERIERFLSSLGLEYTYFDQFSLLRENYRELLLALFLAVFLEYVILASGFRSFTKPILVILMIPASIPGILLILSLTNSSLNINTFMSIIVLVGLLVNNAIMLFLEYQNENVAGDSGVISASKRRLKPILITTSSTILALVPTLFTGNKIQTSLAATLILGLIYSTVVTLLYLPLFYSRFYVRKRGESR